MWAESVAEMEMRAVDSEVRWGTVYIVYDNEGTQRKVTVMVFQMYSKQIENYTQRKRIVKIRLGD